MSSITINFLNSIGRYSIFYTAAAPIYIFASGEYEDPPKLALAILIITVIITTLAYWKNPGKNFKWKIADRLIASSIVIVAFIFGNNDTKALAGAGVYFYLLGHSGDFKNFNSYINHIVFRFFAGLAVLLYIIDSDLWNPIFVGFNLAVVLGLIFINVNKLKSSRHFNRREQIRENILIF